MHIKIKQSWWQVGGQWTPNQAFLNLASKAFPFFISRTLLEVPVPATSTGIIPALPQSLNNISSTRYYPHDQCPVGVQNHRCQKVGTSNIKYLHLLDPFGSRIKLGHCWRFVCLTQAMAGENQGCIPRGQCLSEVLRERLNTKDVAIQRWAKILKACLCNGCIVRIVIKIIYVDASKLPMKTYSKVVTQHFGIILKKHEETNVLFEHEVSALRQDSGLQSSVMQPLLAKDQVLWWRRLSAPASLACRLLGALPKLGLLWPAKRPESIAGTWRSWRSWRS